LPRTLHLQALPATAHRVSSNRVSFSALDGEAQVAPFFAARLRLPMRSAGCPALSHLPALPAMALRVASNVPSFSVLGAIAWGFPRDYAFQSPLPIWAASFLAFRIFRLCRRRIREFPRGLRPSALLTQRLRVSPGLRSSSCALWCGGEFPRSCTLRLCLGSRFQVSLNPIPSAPTDGLPSRLGLRTFRLAVPASSGFPESCIYGWIDDDFLVLPRTLHPRLGRG